MRDFLHVSIIEIPIKERNGVSDKYHMAEQDDSKKKDNGKIVEFPLHRVRKPKASEVPPVPKTPEQKKQALVVSLLSAIVVAMFFSHHTAPSRAPQSIDIRPGLHHDIVIAAKINQESLREPSSLGLEPTLVDQLRFGLLGNRYSLKLTSDHSLRSISFEQKSGAHRIRVQDLNAFVKQYGPLFQIPFDDIKGPTKFHDKQYTFEIFELRDRSRLVAHVNFMLLKDHALEEMTVQPVAMKNN